MKHIFFLALLLSFILTSCFSNEYEEIGNKKVEGGVNLYVKIYQKNKFEHLTPVAFELLNQKDSILIRRTSFTSETPMLQNVKKVHPFLYDDIFYICYPYPKVYAIHKVGSSYFHLPRDTLFTILKTNDSKLIDATP